MKILLRNGAACIDDEIQHACDRIVRNHKNAQTLQWFLDYSDKFVHFVTFSLVLKYFILMCNCMQIIFLVVLTDKFFLNSFLNRIELSLNLISSLKSLLDNFIKKNIL